MGDKLARRRTKTIAPLVEKALLQQYDLVDELTKLGSVSFEPFEWMKQSFFQKAMNLLHEYQDKLYGCPWANPTNISDISLFSK